MDKAQKQQVVADLTEKLKAADTLLVADYRGLTNVQFETLRTRLLEHGARFAVVKNTLTRRAAEAAGADALLALLEGPTAIAFIESDGDPAAVAKALTDTARDTRVLTMRGGLLDGKAIGADDIESLSKLPPLDVLRGQLLGAVVAPLSSLAALLHAPLQNLVGLIDARIEQLEAAGPTGDSAVAESAEGQQEEAAVEDSATEPTAETAVVAEAGGEATEETNVEDSAPAESSNEETTSEEE